MRSSLSELTAGKVENEAMDADIAEAFVTSTCASALQAAQESLQPAVQSFVLVDPCHLFSHNALATSCEGSCVIHIRDVSTEGEVEGRQPQSSIIRRVVHRTPFRVDVISQTSVGNQSEVRR